MSTLDARTFAAVLFDLDGTLIDSTAAVERCWRTWAREFGVDLAVLGDHHGMPSEEAIAGVLPPAEIPAAAARIEQLEIEDVAGIVPLPGALDALAAVPSDRVAIVTSCTKELAAARMGAAGIAKVGVMVTRNRIARGKPDPEGFLLAAVELRREPGECLAVEDAVAGLTAARTAGCARLAVTTTTPAARLEADLIVGTLADVRFIVDAAGVHLRPTSGTATG